jgi:hypothetical protein
LYAAGLMHPWEGNTQTASAFSSAVKIESHGALSASVAVIVASLA